MNRNEINEIVSLCETISYFFNFSTHEKVIDACINRKTKVDIGYDLNKEFPSMQESINSLFRYLSSKLDFKNGISPEIAAALGFKAVPLHNNETIWLIPVYITFVIPDGATLYQLVSVGRGEYSCQKFTYEKGMNIFDNNVLNGCVACGIKVKGGTL